MADVKIISVNPGKKTIGALNLEFMGKVARTCRPMAQAIHTPRIKTICNFIFGINKYTTAAWSSKLWLLRTMISFFFIGIGIMGIMNGEGGLSHIHAIFNIIAGGMIFLGFFARAAATIGFLLNAAIAITAAFGYAFNFSDAEISVIGTEALMQTILPMLETGAIMKTILPIFETEAVMQALLFGIIAITGPGRYSIDQLLRHFIFRKAKYCALRRARNRSERDIANRLSYKAWQSI